MKLKVVFSLLVCAILGSVGGLRAMVEIADPWDARVNAQFRNAAFVNAVDTVLKGSGISYTVDPKLNDVKVNGRFVDVSRREALSRIASSVGATFRKEDNSVTISLGPEYMRYFGWGAPQAQALIQAGDDAALSKTLAEYVKLKYVDASTVLPILMAMPGVQVVQTTGDSLVVAAARDEAMKQFLNTLKMVDAPSSLVHTVKVTLKAEVKVVSKNADQPIARITTMSSGAEGTPMPLSIIVDDKKTTDLAMEVTLTPEVEAQPGNSGEGSAYTITLTGTGVVSGHLPMEFRKQFDIAVSVPEGKEETIASGSAAIGDSAVDITISGSATVEPGRIKPLVSTMPSRSALELQKAEFALKEAQILADKAELDFKDTRERYESGLASKSDLRNAETALALAQNRLQQAQARLAEVGSPLSNLDFGTIMRSLRHGENVGECFEAAETLSSQGKLNEAIEQYREAIRLNPELAAAYEGLAKALYSTGRLKEAWSAVQSCRKYGGKPDAEFLESLSKKMPEPK